MENFRKFSQVESFRKVSGKFPESFPSGNYIVVGPIYIEVIQRACHAETGNLHVLYGIKRLTNFALLNDVYVCQTVTLTDKQGIRFLAAAHAQPYSPAHYKVDPSGAEFRAAPGKLFSPKSAEK